MLLTKHHNVRRGNQAARRLLQMTICHCIDAEALCYTSVHICTMTNSGSPQYGKSVCLPKNSLRCQYQYSGTWGVPTNTRCQLSWRCQSTNKLHVTQQPPMQCTGWERCCNLHGSGWSSIRTREDTHKQLYSCWQLQTLLH